MARRVNIPQSTLDPFYRYKRERIVVSSGKAKTTILTNLDVIAKQLNRSPADLLSYLQKKTATSAFTKPIGYILKGEFSADTLDDLIDEFIEAEVLCSTCGNPETDIDSKKRTCRACGATS